MNFKNIYTQAEARIDDCLLSLWTPGNHPMRHAMKELFKREPFIGEPFFQSAFGWEQIADGVNWKALFEKAVADMIEKIGIKNSTRRWLPYLHQFESWKILCHSSSPGNAQSIVVTSGTGSGKTECFLYPVLNDMYKHKGEGIQAIFMYPLNALANDQKGRIEKCCAELGLQFACYNGNTKEAGQYNSTDVEITSRTAIREHRPDLLLTNPSMLEYILVRDDDKDVMKPNNPQQQKSALRWIVIDEAHTYTGSAAVELKYEIKRVIDAFGAKKEDVHFACTSATIGSNPNALQQFIHELTGQDVSRIHVIGGKRIVPPIPTEFDLQQELSSKGLNIPSAAILQLRQKINDKPFLSSNQIWDIVFNGKPFNVSDIPELLELLDVLCEMSWMNGNSREYLLMLRAHFFMREPSGLYACLNPDCSHHACSPMGYVTSIDSQTCPHCGAPLFELIQCRSCQEFMYKAEEDTATHELRAIRDEFNDEIDNIFADDDDQGQSQSATPYIQGMPITYQAGIASSGRRFTHLTPIYHNIDFFGKKPIRNSANNSGTYVTFLNQARSECCSHCGQISSSNKISGFHLPMDTLKQLVTPVLLAETTPNQGQYWGKYISFTDSRQKTAISAKKFNISVERDFALGAILRRLSEARLYDHGIQPKLLNEFRDIVYSKDIFDHISTDPYSLDSYKAAVLRSAIGRRLLHASGSLETMGLVTVVYPDLRSKNMPDAITIWNNNHPTNTQVQQKDWEDFLKICLDYVVRLGNCIQPLGRNAAPNEKNFIRNNKPTTIFNPNGGNGGKEWPSIKMEGNQVANKQNRIITLLCAAFGINDATDLNQPDNRLLISNILDSAWSQLTGADGTPPILKTDNQGLSYYLDMSTDNPYFQSCYLRLNEYSYLCPVTRKFLDVTFMGYSPMMNGQLARDNMEQYKCSPDRIKMPLLDIQNPNDQQLQQWMQTNNEVIHLKDIGLWSNYMENAFRFRNVYVAAEHSAQIDREILEEYTKQFKGDPNTNGNLNVLNCSTTMEMGVDIGDIDLVYLANVPPQASNYLQRAGRAGRFGQSKSVAFTACPATPDGINTFFTPQMMLEDKAAKRMPKESSIIVERHINSFFFRDFILVGGMAVNGNSSAADFFISSQQGAPSVCDSFIDHLNNIGTRLDVVFSILFPGYSSTSSAIAKTNSKICEIKDNFLRVYDQLVTSLANANGQAAPIAISYQLNKFAEQNLLIYLSEMQFFPNANMPTGIVEFDASNRTQKRDINNLVSQIANLKVRLRNAPQHLQANIRTDLNNRKADLKVLLRSPIVSREARIALNEYAPGQTVVVNEKNFISDAISNRSSYGNQSIKKWISRCDICGWTKYTEVMPQNTPTPCPHCHRGIMSCVGLRDGGNATFTCAKEVVGYSADYNADDDRQEDTRKHFYQITSFLPDFSWNNPLTTGLCDVMGNEGKVVYCNKGKGFGFAIQHESTNCFNLKAVPDVAYSDKPSIQIPRLGWSGRAPFTSNQVDRHVFLTCENTTSYAALRFFDDYQHQQILSSRAFLYSMGTILTRAFCDYLAIDDSEIDFDVNKIDANNFLYLYDTNKGGAGYSSQLSDPVVFEGVIKKAYDIVCSFGCDCRNHPGHACAKCLITRGTYSYAGLLSTANVYQWLKKEMRVFRRVPASIQAISPSCRCEFRLLTEILRDAVDNPEIHSIDLFIPKENELIAADWNDSNSPIGTLLHKAQNEGKKVGLYIEFDKNDYDLTTLSILYNTATALSWFDNVSGAEFDGLVRSAIVLTDVAGIRQNFFTTEFDTLPLSNFWGLDCGEIYQDSGSPSMNPLPLPTQGDILRLMNGDQRMLLDGIISNDRYSTDNIFNDIILKQVVKGNQQMLNGIDSILKNQHVDVQFTENYLVSPIACIILTGLIAEIRDRYNLTIDSINLKLDSNLCVNTNYNFPVSEQYIRYNFDSQNSRDEYIKELMDAELGIQPIIGVNTVDHHRWLRFTTQEKKYVEIRPDHGIGAGWMNDNIRHKHLPSLQLPISFKKHIRYGGIEPSIVYYIVIDR